MSNTKTTVLIVNYNSAQQTLDLIKSLGKIKKYIGEILIIDNKSLDKDTNLLKKIQNATIIYNNENLGFSKAVNQGINIAKHELITLLNPDTIIIDNNFQILLEHFKDKKVAVVGGKILKDKTKKIYFTANRKPGLGTAIFEFTNLKKIFPNNKWSKYFWVEKEYMKNVPIDVDSLCGAFIIFKKSTRQNFNEKYFLYLEDLDFCINLKSKGYRIIYDPRFKISHIGGASSGSIYRTVLKHWYNSRKTYFKDHLITPLGFLCTIIFDMEEHLLSLYHYLKNEPQE